MAAMTIAYKSDQNSMRTIQCSRPCSFIGCVETLKVNHGEQTMRRGRCQSQTAAIRDNFGIWLKKLAETSDY